MKTSKQIKTTNDLRAAMQIEPGRFLVARFETVNGETMLAFGDRLACKAFRIPAEKGKDSDLCAS
jgi:hypothetical protein